MIKPVKTSDIARDHIAVSICIDSLLNANAIKNEIQSPFVFPFAVVAEPAEDVGKKMEGRHMRTRAPQYMPKACPMTL